MSWDSLEEKESQGAESGDGEGGGNDWPGVPSYQVAPAVLTNKQLSVMEGFIHSNIREWIWPVASIIIYRLPVEKSLQLW